MRRRGALDESEAAEATGHWDTRGMATLASAAGGEHHPVMGRGRELSRAERAIHYACTLGGLSLAETNAILAEANFREIRNYDELTKRRYRRYFLEDTSRIGEAIRSPPTGSQISAALSDEEES
jgi:hypothetical protein